MKRLIFAFLVTFAFFFEAQEDSDYEEVVVTANKKEETVQEIPMNISVISEGDIEERGITTPEDFLRTLAGVTTPGGSRFFTFRGLNTSSAQRSAGTSATYVDEIKSGNMNIFDIQRIEVLRGPQGTLYGSNAIGGTIRYITNKPNPEAFESSFSVEYGSKVYAEEDINNYNAMVNVPLIEGVALRAVFSSMVDPGIYQNVMTGKKGVGTQNDDLMRLTLGFNFDRVNGFIRYNVADRVDVGMKEKGNGDKPGNADLVVAGCDTDGAGWWYNWDGYENCARVAGLSADLADYTSLPGLSSYNPLLAFADFSDEIHRVKTKVISSMVNYSGDSFNITVIAAKYETREDSDTEWSRIDMDDLYAAPLVVGSDSEETSFELRVSSNPGDIEWTVGYFYEDSSGKPNQIVENQYGSSADAFDYIVGIIGVPGYDGSAYCPPYCNDVDGYPYMYYGSWRYHDNSREESFFGQISYNWDDFTFSYGLRRYMLDDSYRGSEFGLFYVGDNFGCDNNGDGVGDFADGVTCTELSGAESDTRPKFTASYTPNDNLTVFAVSSAGYRPGGNNAALPYFCANDPEASSFERRYTSDNAQNTEFGFKYRQQGLSLNATYFSIDWQDIQIGIAPACGWSFTYNGGQAETSGLELDFSYDLGNNLYLDFAGAFMSAETTVPLESFGAEAGDSLPGTVESQFNVGLAYETLVMSYPAFARVDLLSYGESYATFAESNNMMAPEYNKLNFNAGVNFGQSAINLSVDNLTDERTEAFRYAVDSPSYRPRDYVQWIPPRSVSIKYSYKF
ncbi:MAG: TonB-dependent receptor [Gammaproteobacteria bacterium]|nr:TonB-dependent receptor [Gammaproteobacteria bacterium]